MSSEAGMPPCEWPGPHSWRAGDSRLCTGPALTVTSQGGPGGAAPVVRSLAGVNSAQEAQSPEYNSQRPNIWQEQGPVIRQAPAPETGDCELDKWVHEEIQCRDCELKWDILQGSFGIATQKKCK